MDELRKTMAEAILSRLGSGGRRPLVVGISGAQGSGKSTLAAALAEDLAAHGVASAVLSLDDLYLTKAERVRLAADVHPLFTTRGVPGTHDLSLAFAAIAALERGETARLPRFDKASDDRLPEHEWTEAAKGTQVVLLEGWCIGAAPQDPQMLAEPVNELERDEDAELRWRGYANRMLERDYRTLFARVDYLAMLAAPSFDAVFGWRRQQERELAASRPGAETMDDAALTRFIAHYERHTRQLLADLPARADLVARLDADRALLGMTVR
jgi:D-glycerate 3-kinase